MPAAIQFFRFFRGAVALCLCASAAAATDMPRYGVFVFSDFCISPMSGDLGGDRITLQRFIDGDTLVYEYNDGSTHAVIADQLAIDAESKSLHFAIRDNGGSNVYVSGKVSSDGGSLSLQGVLFREHETVTLKRTTDFAAPIRACRDRHNGEK